MRKLPHVSANCRLTSEEELTLLGLCVCDPADPRYDHEQHTVYGVLLCKNRRSALRAALAVPDGNVPSDLSGRTVSCAVEVPPRPADRAWILQKQLDLADGVDEERLQTLLQGLNMRHQHYRSLQLDTMLQLLSAYNSRDAAVRDVPRFWPGLWLG